MLHDDFNKVLLTEIEEGPSSLGSSPRKAIYYNLETSFHLKKEDIPLNLSEFKRALERILGHGEPCLEKVVTNCLYGTIRLDLRNREYIDLLPMCKRCKKADHDQGGGEDV